MATYKVPQDVEADDKLIGPFSFRQFIYLLVVAGMIALAWGLAQLFIGLAVIPIPVILLFGALALPLRKDQPMEIYLAAMVSYYLKPHVRMWDPDGVDEVIEITVPHVVEVSRTKDISQDEAQQRLGYLANLVDTQGWAVRGQVAAPGAGTAMTADAYAAAQATDDVLDETNSVSQAFGQRLSQSDAKRHQDMLARMRNPVAAQPVAPAPAEVPIAPPTAAAYAAPDPAVNYNPYPTFQQAVIQPPSDDTAHQLTVEEAHAAASALAVPTKPNNQPPTTSDQPDTSSEKAVSADIMNLANNTDLSIETIAREANRISKKEEESPDEFVISLR